MALKDDMILAAARWIPYALIVFMLGTIVALLMSVWVVDGMAARGFDSICPPSTGLVLNWSAVPVLAIVGAIGAVGTLFLSALNYRLNRRLSLAKEGREAEMHRAQLDKMEWERTSAPDISAGNAQKR
jgi:hypothetical protein